MFTSLPVIRHKVKCLAYKVSGSKVLEDYLQTTSYMVFLD